MLMCKNSRKFRENKQKHKNDQQNYIQGDINNIRNSVEDRQSQLAW